MSMRSVGCLVVAAVLAAAGCTVSPTGPDPKRDDEARTVHPAAHLDCDSAEDIRARIADLESDGTLNHGQATALRAKLDQAERHEAEGRPERAAEAYARLIAQVEEWVADGVLTDEEAADLLTCAQDVLDGPDVSFTAVSAGDSHTCGVSTGGDAYCWGSNLIGALGDGTIGASSDTPVAVEGALDFASISGGVAHSCGVTIAGEAYCWGDGTEGQLGTGTIPTISGTPVAVQGALTFVSISVGGAHTCGVTTGGDAYCWGRNLSGELGDGNPPTGSATPVLVEGGLVFESISAGFAHTCGVTTGGVAYCWGSNLTGALGDGNTSTASDTPVLVQGDLVFESISAGDSYTCAVTTGGDAYCWGSNARGQLGDGNAPTASATPVAVQGALVFESVIAGGVHSCGVTTDGAAYCWGRNTSGELGDGNAPAASATPVLVQGALVLESITAGSFHSCGVTNAGAAYCWGGNFSGQLGDGNAPTDRDSPVAVAQP